MGGLRFSYVGAKMIVKPRKYDCKMQFELAADQTQTLCTFDGPCELCTRACVSLSGDEEAAFDEGVLLEATSTPLEAEVDLQSEKKEADSGAKEGEEATKVETSASDASPTDDGDETEMLIQVEEQSTSGKEDSATSSSSPTRSDTPSNQEVSKSTTESKTEEATGSGDETAENPNLNEIQTVVCADGRTMMEFEGDIWAMFLMNASNAAADSIFAPFAHLSDGALDLVLARGLNKKEMAQLFFDIEKGDHVKNEKVKYFRVKNLTLEPISTSTVDIDGEFFPNKKTYISVLPGVATICL